MKTSQIILVGALAGFASAAITSTVIIQSDRPTAAAEPALTVDPHEERLASLETSQRELTATINFLRSQLENTRTPADENADLGEVERLVALALEKLAAAGKLTSAEAGANPEAIKAAELNIAAHALELLADDLTDAERQALWAKAHKAGQGGELLAWFEQRAEADQNNADAQADLGGALLQMLFVVPEGPAKGQLAVRADGAFDKALEIDDHHWEARYSKAVSLSFWPAAFGKQQEAINHFETLVTQQAEASSPEDSFASTHLLLGNMYTQIGQPEQAMAAWQSGIALFPENTGLLEQLEAHQ